MTYAFTFDASACTGCKACQIACKDKNNLPTGVLWRRVYEISGGSWTNVGADGVRLGVWQTDVFAYNLSIACNHCVHPKCAGVCPTDAYVVRDDGIVYIDETKCMGCGYCAWACPYSAPRYNPELRHMTKCNFCYDNIDAGLPPACVAACPLRVLEFVEVSSEQPALSDTEGSSVNSFQPLWEKPGTEHPFPLPTFSRTQPHLALKSHAGMGNGLEKVIANREEIKPPSKSSKTFVSFVPFVVKGFDELSLVIFTLCGQMAAGMAVFSFFGGPLSVMMLAILAGLIGISALASLLHLGTPLNAWRALNHLKKSWLSREILMFGLFGASWLALMAEHWFLKTDDWLLITALLGLGLVYSMAQVYHFKAAPAWNTWRTNATFFLSAGVLGVLGANLAAGLAGVWFMAWVLLAAEAGLAFLGQNQVHETVCRIRVGLIVLAMLGLGFLPVVPESAQMWLNLPIFLIALLQEILGRWLFYEARQPLL